MQHDKQRSTLHEFLAAADPEQAMALVAEAPEDLLAGETLAELDRLIASETDEGRRAFLAERRELLNSLRTLRQQFGELQEQLAALPEAERQFLAFMAIPNDLGMAALLAGSDDAALDSLEATATAKVAEADGDAAGDIRARLADLRQLRAEGREAAQAQLEAAQEAAGRLGDALIAWIQTDDWDASEHHLREHAGLLTEDGDAALAFLQLANPGNDAIPMHRQLLRFARERGIDAAYVQLRQELAQAEELEELGELGELREAALAMAENPLMRAMAEFVSAESDDDARDVLDSRRTILLTVEARTLLEQFAAVARQQGDAAVQARLEARLALWQAAWRGRVAGPLRRQDEPSSETAQDRQDHQPVSERGDRIVVIGNHNSVVMPGGKIFRIVNVPDVPLQWRRPVQTRPDLASDAVGREQELAELHQRLQAEGAAALLGKGAAAAMHGRAAVRGHPGIGKTVLAAMYATQHAGDFPGGVLWLDIGPSKRTAADIAGDLQQLATPAYADPVQAQEMLKHCELAPETVHALLSDHGRLLVVLDDYSYDYLGEDPGQGRARQAWLRGLGVFAQEADFDQAAAAAVWALDAAPAEAVLELLAGLALIKPVTHAEEDAARLLARRWQQHAILRAYALSLQDQEERLSLRERHADYYVDLARVCYRAIPRNDPHVETEFKQIEHAFGWCLDNNPTRAVALYEVLSDFMTNRGRSAQAMQWGQAALEAAGRIGARLGTANTLKSLGDLESRLGNIDQARQHYDAALPLYQAEQDRLGTANTLKSLGDLESRLGNIDQARQHYDAALRLYRLEQEPGGMINTLVAQARLEMSEGNVDQAKKLYEQAFQVADRTGFAGHPVVQGMRQEYAALEGLAGIEDNPLAAGLAALMQANSDQALAQAMAEHPILHEAQALFLLAGLLGEALKQQQSEVVARLVVFLAVLLERYNHTHSEQIDVEAHTAVIDLGEQVIPVAEQINASLAAMLRQQAGWACNTLGNHYADQVKDLEQAVAAYTRGLALDPANAVLLRNRAGVHLDRGDLAAAQADIEVAAALAPDAPRLADLRAALGQVGAS